MLSYLKGGFHMNNNESENKIITFRKNKFDKLLNELARSVGGLAFPIFPYISTQQGKYSQQKTIKLINYILDGLDINDEKLLDFYNSLLYCAVRVLSTPYIIYDGGNTFALSDELNNSDPKFSDLVDFLHYEELYLLEGVKKCPIVTLLADIMIEIFNVLSEKKHEKSNILLGTIDYYSDDSSEPSWANYPDYVDDFQNSEEPYDTILEEQKLQRDQENIRLKREFPYPEEYCRHFENIINQFDENFDFKHFNNHVQSMINIFLTNEGLSIFNDENSYIAICTYIKKTIKKSNQMQGEILNGSRKRRILS